MSCPFDFCERGERPFFSISGSLLYPSFHLFRTWLFSMLWCRLIITHFSISLLSPIFILFLHFTLPHLISLFSHPAWCLTWVQHLHFILTYSICHSFIIIFHLGILRSATHDVFYALCLMLRGMGIISLGSLSLVSFYFFHPITSTYVTSRVLRPPWGHDFTYYVWRLTLGQYSRLVEDYFLGHDGWEVGVMDYTEAYLFYQWWIFRGDVIYTRAYPAHQWQFLSRWYPTLGHSHFREHFCWRYSHSTQYSILEHIPLIDSWFF